MSKLKTALVVGAIASTSILGVSATTLATANNERDEFASKISDKFDLNKDEVKKFIAEEHQAREQEREKNVSDNLQKKVDDGTITAEQKQKLETKLKEMKDQRKADRQQSKDSRPNHEDMKQKREAQKVELEKWAIENGIDLETVLPRHGEGPKHGPRS